MGLVVGLVVVVVVGVDLVRGWAGRLPLHFKAAGGSRPGMGMRVGSERKEASGGRGLGNEVVSFGIPRVYRDFFPLPLPRRLSCEKVWACRGMCNEFTGLVICASS